MSEHKNPPTLRPGCYLMWFKPTEPSSDGAPTACIGTFRVTNHHGHLRASSDLYEIHSGNLQSKINKCTARGGKIPTFPLEDYRYYLEVSIEGNPSQVRLNFRGHRFDSNTQSLQAGSHFQVELTGTPPKNPANRAAAGYPTKLTGQLIKGNENDGLRGELGLQYLGEDLRRAHVRLIRIQPKPNDTDSKDSKKKIRLPGRRLSGGVPGWARLFHEKVRWQLEVSEHDGSPYVQSIPHAGWGPFDLGLAATDLRQPKALPIKKGPDWVYDLLCVPQFDQSRFSRFLGMMFDSEAADLNQSARECAAVAALETVTVGGGEHTFKGIAQDLFGGRLYYRTALHEVGHAMNLTHTLYDNCIMNTTEFLLPTEHSLSSKGKKDARIARQEFKDAFSPEFAFSPEDRHWLQHAPDIAVRPGGISRNQVGWACECKKDVNFISLRNEPLAELLVKPVLPKVPFGAPVRLNYTLVNYGRSLKVPKELSLEQGVLSGRVVGPDSLERYFRSHFRCCGSNSRDGHLMELATGKQRDNSVTLLRGTDGPLFPLPGNYNIKLELRWDENGRTNRVVGRTSIIVSEINFSDSDSERFAEIALNEPNLMPALVEGLLNKEGLEALSLILHSSVLAPHYLPIALHCYLRGQERGFNWNKILKPAHAHALPLGGGAANGRRNNRTALLATSPPPSIPPPVTKQERTILNALFRPEPKPKPKPRGKPQFISKPRPAGPSLDKVSRWLDRVMLSTHTHSTEDGIETIRQLLASMGEDLSGKPLMPKARESIWPKTNRRSHQPLVQK